MSNSVLPPLPEYAKIREFLSTERSSLIKVHDFSPEENLLRTIEEANTILDWIEKAQTKLFEFFQEFPSLVTRFNKEFMDFTEFLHRENIIELCFMDEWVFPEKEIYYIGEVHGEDAESLKVNLDDLFKWIEESKGQHTETQNTLQENFSMEIHPKDLKCDCNNCLSFFRAKIRDGIFDESVILINKTKDQLEEKLHQGIKTASKIFMGLQKQLDKNFYKFRHRLKRSTLKKLETQVKNHVREEFCYPSEISKTYIEYVRPFLLGFLDEENLPADIIDETTLDRFFKQLSRNLWRGEKYLEVEFKKLIKSVTTLKRQDISASILRDYLGEFWIHSPARRMKRKIIYHRGPTNSGKTYHAVETLCNVAKGCYLAPLRLLAAELYDTMNSKGAKTTLLTGEEVIEIEDATHFSSTIEMAKFNQEFDCCVIDEIQMITDTQRGWAWTRALINIMADEVHLCGDGSVLDLIQKIVELCGDELEVRDYERMTNLKVDSRPIRIGDLTKSDALIVFSRRNALRYKFDLEQLGFKVSIVYGRLSPEVRREQARKFDQGETDIMVSTDAIAMGMNLPIRRIVFSTLSKFFDNQEFVISQSEIKQIAGRAGRYKRFPTGHVTCLSKVEDGIDSIREAISTPLPQKVNVMVGPDLEIFGQVNNALNSNGLKGLSLSEFLRLFNTMNFKKPFYCVDLKEMIELAEMVEEADYKNSLTHAEVFGFSCAPVNLGLMDHVQYYLWILNNFVRQADIKNEPINHQSNDIDYLETAIKCVELYQWLARHFNNHYFDFDEYDLIFNKGKAIEKLNSLLSDKIVPTCASCGATLEENSKFAICEECFRHKRFRRRGGRSYSNQEGGGRKTGKKRSFKRDSRGGGSSKKKTSKSSNSRSKNTKKKSSRKYSRNKKTK